MKDTGVAIIIGAIVLAAFLLLGSFVIPWNSVSWGRIKLLPGESITVTGEAKTQQRSQVGTFSSGVSSVGDDKDTVMNEVNQKTQAIIDAAKAFGIKAEDIKTRDMNVYRGEENYYEDGRQKSRPGQWRVSNNIEVKLRDVDRASALTDVLSRAGATNIYGPNFTLDETDEAENALIDEAMKDAREKAGLMAKAANRKIKRVVNIVEGYAPQPQYLRMEGGGGGGGGGYEPGTGTVSKTLTVTFELE